MSDPTVVLFGGGGHGRAVADVAARLGHRVVAVVDAHTTWPGVPALRNDAEGASWAHEQGLPALLGVGANGARLRLARFLLDAGVTLPPLVARSATVATDARLGSGTVVLEHAHVGPGTALGTACLVNTGAIVEHGCALGDGVHCAPGSVLAGAVRCRREVLIGAGAVLLPGLSVGARATVGAGAVVTRSVESGITVRGMPARPSIRLP